MDGKPVTYKMDVPGPVYHWLLGIKTQLRIERGRNVTWPEVFEYVQQQAAGR